MPDTAPDPFDTRLDIEQAGVNAVEALHTVTGLSKQAIKQAMMKGAVWLQRGKRQQRLRRAKRALQPGDVLHLYYDPRILAETAPAPTLIEDHQAYSIWYKPYGLRSQGSRWGDHCTLVRWTEQHLEPQRPAHTVHRLDRAATGLMLIAHTRTTAAALSKLFRDRAITKQYRARVRGSFPADPDVLRISEALDDKAAVSEVSLVSVADDGSESLVEVAIETGRKHQIRRHLAGAGYPILGDRLYGAGRADGVDLQLTAFRLAFQCPVTGQAVDCRLPDHLLPRLPAG